MLYAGAKLRWAISAIILLGYWWLLQLSSQPYTLEYSLVRQIDMAVLGANHLWQGKGMAFDPEGLLSTLPAIVNVILGFEVARVLSLGNSSSEALKKLAAMSSLLIVAALVWNQFFPINKSLWTSPFVLLTSGVGIAVLLVYNCCCFCSIIRAILMMLADSGPLVIGICGDGGGGGDGINCGGS